MLTYALLSPTFGMHQYTADLARRANRDLGLRVRVVTTSTLPEGRYWPATDLITPIATRGTGFAREGLDVGGYRRVQQALLATGREEIVHFTGVHLWNVPLVYALRRHGIQVIHTLHDLAPHSGVRHGGLIRAWNRLIIASGATILVHGECHRDELVRRGVCPARVISTPLLHGFWGWEAEERIGGANRAGITGIVGTGDGQQIKKLTGCGEPVVIFFGRLEWYKGIDTLLEAWSQLGQATGDRITTGPPRLILAGRLADGLTLPELPANVELRNRRISDNEALDLFAQADLLVLPYRDATQSALIAAAARLGVPSLVTRTGALPEYVADGVTGWIAPPEDPEALAQTLRQALSNPEQLRRVGQAAQAWYHNAREIELTALASLYGSLSQSVGMAEVNALALSSRKGPGCARETPLPCRRGRR